MHRAILDKRDDVVEACRRNGVVRLDVFGSGAREVDFDSERSDADFLVDFEDGYGVDQYLGLKQDLEKALGRSVDLVTRSALEYGPGGRLDRKIETDARLVYERRARPPL